MFTGAEVGPRGTRSAPAPVSGVRRWSRAAAIVRHGDQVGLTDRPAPQQQQMARVAHQPQGAQSPSNGPDRHRTVAAEIAELPGQAAGVERLRRDRPEHHRGGLHRPTQLRIGQLEFR
jgi:hypothetical protein